MDKFWQVQKHEGKIVVLGAAFSLLLNVVCLTLLAYYFGEWMARHWFWSIILFYLFVLNPVALLSVNAAVEIVWWANKASKRLFG